MISELTRRARLGVTVTGAIVVFAWLYVSHSTFAGLLVMTTLGLLALIGLVHFLCSWPDDTDAERRIMRWTLGAFAVHLAIGLVISSSHGLSSYLGGDAYTYHSGARDIVNHWATHAPITEFLPRGKEGFYYLVAAQYWFFGPAMRVALPLNAAMAAAAIPLLADLTRRIFGPKAMHYVPPLLILLPGFLLWPSELLRESGIMFLMAVALNAAARLVIRTRFSSLLVMVLALGFLFTFRSYMALAVGAGLIIGIALGRRGLGGVTTGVGTFALMLTVVFGLGIGYSGYNVIATTDPHYANNIRLDSSQTSKSGYLREAPDISTTHGALSYLPLAFPYFAFGPFPWQVLSARQIPAIPDAAAWWYLLPSLWSGIAISRRTRDRRVVLFLVPALVSTIILALLVANFGTVVRLRMQVILLLVPVIAAGMAHRRDVGGLRPLRRKGAGQQGFSRPISATSQGL